MPLPMEAAEDEAAKERLVKMVTEADAIEPVVEVPFVKAPAAGEDSRVFHWSALLVAALLLLLLFAVVFAEATRA
jgi:uncharacterized integral membrane protein